MGEISDVCIKRKLRNRMQDMGNAIFVQSEDRCDDGFKSLSDRATAATKGSRRKRPMHRLRAKSGWMYGASDRFSHSRAMTRAVSPSASADLFRFIRQSASLRSRSKRCQITKSVNGETGEKRSSDTMGTKHFVRFGFYEIKGAINVQLAEKTGFSQEDAAVVKECLRTLFVNDASAARPEGSMEVVKLFWWEHNCKEGQYSSAKVHRSVHVTPKNPEGIPTCVDDYEITLDELPGLVPEIIDGV